MGTRSKEREQFLADVIIGAVEGGTGYWATVLRYRWIDVDDKHLPPAEVHAVIMEDDDEHHDMLNIACDNFISNEGRKPTILELLDYGISIDPEVDDGDPLMYKLDIDTIAKGLNKIVKGEVQINSRVRGEIIAGNHDNDAGMIDADGADCIVQVALFGEIVYG